MTKLGLGRSALKFNVKRHQPRAITSMESLAMPAEPEPLSYSFVIWNKIQFNELTIAARGW